MAKPEGRLFKFDSPKAIQSGFLETLPYSGGRQLIECSTNEFSAVCPYSGLPDVATVEIKYVPRRKIVELKSLKYYFVSFRNVGITQEDVTDRIFRDLKKLLSPAYLRLTTRYNTRGGIDTVCTMQSGKNTVSKEQKSAGT